VESGQHSIECCCAFRRGSTSKGHAAIATALFYRENASKHYYRRTNYRVQMLKVTAFVDTENQVILDVHCTTEKSHDTQFDCEQRLQLGGITRETPERRRKTADQTLWIPAHRLRTQRVGRRTSLLATSDVWNRPLDNWAHTQRRRACTNLGQWVPRVRFNMHGLRYQVVSEIMKSSYVCRFTTS
jgi:hypothetical protein